MVNNYNWYRCFRSRIYCTFLKIIVAFNCCRVDNGFSDNYNLTKNSIVDSIVGLPFFLILNSNKTNWFK